MASTTTTQDRTGTARDRHGQGGARRGPRRRARGPERARGQARRRRVRHPGAGRGARHVRGRGGVRWPRRWATRWWRRSSRRTSSTRRRPTACSSASRRATRSARASTRSSRNANAYKSDARITGVQIQQMLPEGTEVLVGAIKDPSFGPVVTFGLGGILVEVLRDVTFRLAPVSGEDALDMVGLDPHGRDPARGPRPAGRRHPGPGGHHPGGLRARRRLPGDHRGRPQPGPRHGGRRDGRRRPRSSSTSTRRTRVRRSTRKDEILGVDEPDVQAEGDRRRRRLGRPRARSATRS